MRTRLTLLFLIILPLSAAAQDDSALQPGAWALQFQVTENFTLDDFQGSVVSVKYHSSAKSALDGFMMGAGFLLVLVTLGSLREIIGAGTLFANAHLMFGEGARGLTLSLGDAYPGLLMAILPPGAFIGLGLMIALKNVIDARRKQSEAARAEAAAAEPKAA